MAMTVALSHKTHYKFDRPVSLSPHVIRLRPAPHSRTPIESYSLKILPKNHFINWQQDPFGNYLARIVFPEKTRELAIDVEVIADLVTINPFDFVITSYSIHYTKLYEMHFFQNLKINCTLSPIMVGFSSLSSDSCCSSLPLKYIN